MKPELTAAQVNSVYIAQLRAVLTWRQSIGIVGGRPSSSLYFIGFQHEHVLYLDPHEVQPVSRYAGVKAWSMWYKMQQAVCDAPSSRRYRCELL